MSFQFHIPPVNKLSFNQRHAIGLPLEGNECLLITGCPGSGKTTVANFRAASLQKEKRSFKYIIYARLLEAYVKKSFSSPELGISEEKVTTFGSWFYQKYKRFVLDGPRKVHVDIVEKCFRQSGKEFTEMIFDETQDLDINLIGHLPTITDSLTICADDAQNVYDDENGTTNSVELMRSVIESKGHTTLNVFLEINYRNPPEIYAFAKAIIPNNPSSEVGEFMKEPGQKPVVQILNNENEMFGRILNIINNRRNENIGILCDRIDQIKSVVTFLKAKNIDLSYFHSKLPKEERKEQLEDLKNVVVCTNKSAKGLEFQTVIIPYIEEMKTDDTSRKSYYVACTRAERTLFLMTSSSEKPTNLLSQIDSSLYEKI